MDKKSVPWTALLSQVVTEPGCISRAYSAFHNYSLGNQMLAYSQCAARGLDIAPIATFKRWQDLGRQVKRGEKALALYMPVTIKRKDENGDPDGAFQTFVVRNNWFTLDQTDGEDYAADVVTPEWDAKLALDALGIVQIAFKSPSGNTQGYACGNAIAINPVAALPHKTRFHELAHVVLGHTKEHLMNDNEHTPRDIREVEAESVAYILCSVLGLPGLKESRGYVQNWLGGETITDKSAMKIFGAANRILKAGQVVSEGGAA
jgi:antirestriction protein ArdC